MVKGFIFDMDGVIVDTEYLDFQLQKEFIKYYHPQANFSEEELLELVGKSYQDLYSSLQKFTAYRLSLEEIAQKFTDFSEEKYRQIDYLPIFRESIFSLLDEAKSRGIKLAVASSSTYDHIVEVLEACGIETYFDVISSGEYLAASKPHPEIYLQTVEKLGLEPQQCLAMEDSTYGIQAAKAAGLTVIAYKEERLKIDQSQADFVVRDMAEALEFLKSVLK